MVFGGALGGGNRVHVDIIGDASHLQRTTKEARRDVDKFGNQVEGRLGRTSGFIKGAFAAAAGAAIVRFGRDAIESFSNLEQAVGGTEAVFGDARGAIDDFASRSADSIGLAESEFRTATTLIGGQLKRMTGDVEFAAEQSIILTETAADLAATYGGTTKEAVEALGSAFRGEADPAERFNLDLKIGRVNAKALEMGLADTTSEIDDQARAQALLALIAEQSADAQGQFAREADTTAGAVQRAEAELEDMKATLGELVAGPFGEFVGLASDAVAVLDGLAGIMGDINGEGFSFINFAEKAFPPTKILTDGLGLLADMFRENEDESGAMARKVSKLTDEEKRARAAISQATGAIDDQADSAEDAADEIKNLGEEMLAAADPAFNLAKRQRDFAEAQREANDAISEFGPDSAEARDAQLGLLESAGELSAAQQRFSTEFGPQGEEAMRKLAEAAGLYGDDLEAILRFLQGIDSTTRRIPPMPRAGSLRSGGGGDGSIGPFHTGGRVNAPRGQEVMARVLGGEHISANGNGDGTTYNVFVLSSEDFRDAMRDQGIEVDRLGLNLV